MTQPAKDSLSHDPLINEAVGDRYVIEKLIGRGGVGLVYLATDKQQPTRKVVVKVLAPHWAEDVDAVARFDREAKRMAKLDHPNVVKMHAHGHHGDATYIVMEFLDGEPLRRYLNRVGTLPFDQFIPIASQILAGVGYVHARDTMLRDIKPPNIMLCERDGKANHVKLLDFGLAKLIEEENEITKAHVIGTAGYLAPEQIKGEPIDVRVDVYALGILFFIMLAGESPIVGENDGAILFNHVHGKPKQLRDLLPDGHGVPDSCIDLIHQCLSKDPADRPQDANEMAEVLFETVHPSLFVLPEASEDTRAPAREYWAERMKRGPNAVSLEEDEDESIHTNPIKKRTLEEVRQAAKVEDDEITGEHALVQRTSKAEAKKGVRPANTGRSAAAPAAARSAQAGNRPRTIPPPPPPGGRVPSGRTTTPPPPPRATTPRMPVPPPRGATPSAPPIEAQGSAAETLTGMPLVKPSELDAPPAPDGAEADLIRRKQTIMGMPRPKPELGAPEPGTPEPVQVRGKPAPEVIIPPLSHPPTAGQAQIGARARKNRVPTIGTAVLKANQAQRTRRPGSQPAISIAEEADVDSDATHIRTDLSPPQRTEPRMPTLDVPPTRTEPRTPTLDPPKGLTMPPPSSSGSQFRVDLSSPAPASGPAPILQSGPNPAVLVEAPKGRTIAMDVEDVKRATVAGGGPVVSGPSKALGRELYEEDAAAASALLGTTPMDAMEQPSNTRFSLLLVVGGIAALALGVLTAWLVLDKGDGADKSEAAAKGTETAKPDEKPPETKPTEPEAPPPEDVKSTVIVRTDNPDQPGAGDGVAVAGDDSAADGAAVDVVLGSIAVDGMTGARVEIDGEDVGAVPFRGEVGVGDHEIRVSASGYQTYSETVQIAEGETTAVEASLKKKSSGGSSTKKSDGGKTPPKEEPTTPQPPPKDDPPPQKEPKKDVFMNTDDGKPSGGIFLPVGKGK